MKPLTIKDAVQFIRANGITSNTDDELTMLIHKAIKYHAFDHVRDANTGDLLGLYIGEWVRPFTVFKVNLLLGKNCMLTLMKRFKKNFPLLETVVTGRHQKQIGAEKSTYTDEVVPVEYHPNTFKLVS